MFGVPAGRSGMDGTGSAGKLSSEAAAIDPELLDLGLERLPRNSEPRGGTRRARDAARALAESLLDQSLLTLDEIGDEGSKAGAPIDAHQPGRIDRQRVVLAENHRSFDDVLKLANVAGPVVRLQLV